MRRVTGWVLLFGPAMVALSAGLVWADDFGDAYKKSLGSVVVITAVDLNWGRSAGSGVVISESGYVLTAYHVVGSDRLISAHLPAYDKDGQLITDFDEYDCVCDESEVVVVARSEKRDLALLKFKNPPAGLKALSLAGKSAGPGEAVFTIGNDAEASMWHFISGNTRQVHHSEHQMANGQKVSARIVEVTVPLNGGDSGGPLLDKSGDIVGINSSVTSGLNAIGNCIDVSEIKAFIDEVNQMLAERKAAATGKAATPGNK